MKRSNYILCVLLVFIVMCSGCMNKDNQAVKLSKPNNTIQGMEEKAPTGAMAATFYEKVYYEVENITWENNSGDAKVTVFTPDLDAVVKSSIEQALSACGSENYDALLEEVKHNVQMQLESKDCPVIESDVQMKAEKTENGYTLVSNEEFERIVSGNIESIFLKALMEGLGNEIR